jgi:hypothetical protein
MFLAGSIQIKSVMGKKCWCDSLFVRMFLSFEIIERISMVFVTADVQQIRLRKFNFCQYHISKAKTELVTFS